MSGFWIPTGLVRFLLNLSNLPDNATATILRDGEMSPLEPACCKIFMASLISCKKKNFFFKNNFQQPKKIVLLSVRLITTFK